MNQSSTVIYCILVLMLAAIKSRAEEETPKIGEIALVCLALIDKTETDRTYTIKEIVFAANSRDIASVSLMRVPETENTGELCVIMQGTDREVWEPLIPSGRIAGRRLSYVLNIGVDGKFLSPFTKQMIDWGAFKQDVAARRRNYLKSKTK